ncbi:hypothetical protein [Agrobacterium sp.]|uniref:PBECR3 domain-containing polyvalent protein n=1 Tax=Agrobacterium sp. TaxID=361 RepID=UPI0028A91966
MENKPDTQAQAEQKRQQTTVHANIVMQSLDENPDDVARYQKLARSVSKETGRPTPSISLVKENEPTFQRIVDNKRTSELLAESPILASWLTTNKVGAALTKDDLPNMSWWEKLRNDKSNAPAVGPQSTFSPLNTLDGIGPVRAEVVTPKLFSVNYSHTTSNATDKLDEHGHQIETADVGLQADAPSFLKNVVGNVVEIPKGIPAGAGKEVANIMEGMSHILRPSHPDLRKPITVRIAYAGDSLPEQVAFLEQDIFSQNAIDQKLARDTLKDILYGRITPDEALKRLNSDYTSPLNEASKLLVRVGDSIYDYSETILPAAPGMEDGWGRRVGETIGAEAPGAVASLVPGLRRLITTVGGGGGQAREARRSGQSEDVQSQMMKWGAAISLIPEISFKKTGSKLYDSGKSRLPIKKAPETIATPLKKEAQSETTKLIGKVAAGPVGDIVEDAFKDGIQTIVQNLVVQSIYDKDKTWHDGLPESIVASLVLSKFSYAAGKAKSKLERDTSSAQKAMLTRQTIEDISAQAGRTKLQQRAPEEFENYVAETTQQTQFENTYVDANTLFDQIAADGSDPYLFAEVAGITKQQLDAARESGGDLKIPTSIYTARIATTADALVKNQIRFDPDAMSYTQALEHNKNSDSKRNDVQAETVKTNEKAKADTLAAAKIYHESMQRGISNGQSEAVARGDALMQTTIYSTTEKRNGTTPETLTPIYSGSPQSNSRSGDSVPNATSKANNESAIGGDRETRAKANAEFGKSAVQSLLHVTKNGPSNKNRKKNVGRAGDSVVQAVRDATGLDISNTRHSLGTTTIRDTLNTKHPDPQRQVVQADVEAIPDITSSADRIISGAKNSRGQPVIGYIKHMSDGRTLYLEQTKTGPKTFTVNVLTKYPAGTDLDTVSQTVLSDVRAKNGDNVKMTPVTKGDTQPVLQEKAGGKRTSASESRLFGGLGTAVIQALIGAGLTEVAHQGVSYFLEQQQDMAERGEQTAIAAVARLNDWWGQNAKTVTNLGAQTEGGAGLSEADGAIVLGAVATDNTTNTAAVDSGLQTQFSHAFETYLLEGKVPSPELADTFETARKWLTTAYRTVTTFGGRTGPEVAEVFNRMLVSDGQLEMARLDAGESGPIFSSADAMGLSKAAYADFTAIRQQSEDEASAEMLQSVIQPVRREQDKAYAQEKATVRTQVEKQVNTEGHYRATELMSNRHWLGDGEMPDHLADIRFDEAMLVAHYGNGILGLLPRGSQTVYTDKGGLDPDDVASIFGYGSGDELLRLMVTAPSRNDRIDSETARIMRERHGDPLYDGTADLKAMDAIHNDRRGQWLEIELKAVGRLSNTTQNTTLKDAHASAVSMMSNMSVADAMESRRFLAAERRAAEEAERLGVQLSTVSTVDPATPLTMQNGDAAVDADISTGTFADNNETAKKLYTAKKRQLLNHALYVESRKIAHEVEEMEGYVQSVDTPARREQFALASFHDNGRINYNSAMDDLLGRYELNASQSMQANVHFGTWAGRQAGATGGLDVFIEQMKAAGRENELAITDEVISSTTRTPYQKLPLQSLRGVVNSIRNLQHIAMRAGKLVDAEQTRDFEQTVSGVLGAFTRTPSGAQQSTGNGTASAAADTGGTAGTKGYERPRPYLDPAMNANLVLRDLDGSKKAGTVQAAIKAPVDAASGRLLARKQKAASDLAALYNVYSPAERQDMGRRLHVPALGTSISKWDMIAIALNTGTAENRRQLTDETIAGSFSEQQVVSVLKYLDARDADFVQSVWDYTASFKPDIAAREKRVTGVTPQWVDATPVVIGGKKLAGGYYPLRDNTDDVSQALVAGKFAKAHTSGLHGGQQQGQTAVPLELDMSVLHSHVNELVHDLELSEVVANTGRLLRDERIQAAFIQTDQGADHVMLQGWLRDATTGDTSGAALLSGTARFAKNNVTAARLATELGSSMTQMSGLSEAMTSIGEKQFADNLQTALRPGVMRRVAALSPFMSSRQGTFEHSSGGNTPLGGLSNWVMQRLNYQMVEVPVWLAGYHQGLDTYRRNEAKAISHADRLVKQLQTSRDGKPSDNAMTGPKGREVEALLTALGALMTTKSGTGENSVPQGRMPVSNDAAEGIALAIDIAALFHTDAVLKAVAHGKSPAGDAVSALSIAETMPFFRDAESPKTGAPRRGKAQRYNDNNGTKRLAGMISASGVLNDIDTAGLMATLNTTGLSFGLPATQISQVVEGRMPQTKGGETSLIQLLTTRSA